MEYEGEGGREKWDELVLVEGWKEGRGAEEPAGDEVHCHREGDADSSPLYTYSARRKKSRPLSSFINACECRSQGN